MDVILVDWEETKSNVLKQKTLFTSVSETYMKNHLWRLSPKNRVFFEKRLNLDDKSNAIDCKIFDSILSGSANRLDW